MDQGEKEAKQVAQMDVDVGKLDADHRKAQDELLRIISQIYTFRKVVPKEGCSLPKIVADMYGWFEQILNLFRIEREANYFAHRTFLLHGERIKKLTEAMEELQRKMRDYEPYLAYIKKFAENKEKEDRELGKWK